MHMFNQFMLMCILPQPFQFEQHLTSQSAPYSAWRSLLGAALLLHHLMIFVCTTASRSPAILIYICLFRSPMRVTSSVTGHST